MSESKIHIPAKRLIPNTQGVVRLTPEAIACLTEVAEESGQSAKQIASMIIVQAVTKGLIIYDREE